jgi:hypothetical protein
MEESVHPKSLTEHILTVIEVMSHRAFAWVQWLHMTRFKGCRAPDKIGTLLGLAAKKCSEVSADPVNEKERELLRNQVPGWRVETVGDAQAIRRDWAAQVQAALQSISCRP